MPVFKIRLVEEILLYGFSDVTIEATTADEAASIVLASRTAAICELGDDPLVTLPNGQKFKIDPSSETLDTRYFCVLLSDEEPIPGHPIELGGVGEIPPPLDYLANIDETR